MIKLALVMITMVMPVLPSLIQALIQVVITTLPTSGAMKTHNVNIVSICIKVLLRPQHLLGSPPELLQGSLQDSPRDNQLDSLQDSPPELLQGSLQDSPRDNQLLSLLGSPPELQQGSLLDSPRGNQLLSLICSPPKLQLYQLYLFD